MANPDKNGESRGIPTANVPQYVHEADELDMVPPSTEETSNHDQDDPMELDSDTRPQLRTQARKDSISETVNKTPRASMNTVTDSAPARPPKILLQTTPQEESSQDLKDRLLEALIDDKNVLKNTLADANARAVAAEKRADEANERVAIAEKRVRAAEAQVAIAAAKAQVVTKRPNERDHELARLRENEKIYQHKERIFKDVEIQADATKEELRRTCAALETMKKKETEAQKGIRYWQDEVQLSTNKVKQLEASLKQIQEKSLRDVTGGRWNPIPDKEIQDRLYVLYQDVRDWAKQWATSSLKLDSMPQESRKDFVENFLVDFVSMNPPGKLPGEIATPSAKMKDKMPWLLLSAALSFEIEDQFFRNRFFCAEAKQVESIRAMHKLLLKANPREGHIWRSMIWRILNPPAAGRSPHDQAVSQETQRRVLVLCDRLDTEFKKGHARWLLRTVNSDGDKKDRAKALRDILTKAAGIATLLWVQRSYLKCVGLYQLSSRQETFNVRSSIMQSHALNKVDIENTGNNGRRILLVVRPAILAFEEDDIKGLDGGDPRVLAPAIVFLEDAVGPTRKILSSLGFES